MSFGHHESAASLLLEYYSNGLAQTSLFSQSGHGRGRRCLAPGCGAQPVSPSSSARQRYHFHPRSLPGLLGMLQRSFTGQQSLSGLRGNRRHSPSVWIGLGRQQLGMRVLHIAALRPRSSAALWMCCPLITCLMRASSFLRRFWPLRGCKCNLNRKKKVPEADSVVSVYSSFPGLSIWTTIKIHAQ